MELDRLDTGAVDRTLEELRGSLEAAAATLGRIARRLTAEERSRAVKPTQAFPDAARAMVASAESEVPALAASLGFDGGAILEDLDNAEALVPIIARLQALLRTAEDTRLAWLAEAYEGAMPLYRVASAGALTDARLEAVATPMRPAFPRRRSRRAKAGPAIEGEE